MVKQKTIFMPEKNEKIKIIVKSKSYCNKPNGFNVSVVAYWLDNKGGWRKKDGDKYHCKVLNINEAMIQGYLKFIRTNR